MCQRIVPDLAIFEIFLVSFILKSLIRKLSSLNYFSGRKSDPEKDENYQKIVAIEKRSLEIMQKFIEVSNQVEDIEKGHLAKEHHEQALKDLEKKSKTCSESWMRALESLDGISLNEEQTLAKSKRKSVVNSTNAHMDKAEEILQRIKKLRSS